MERWTTFLKFALPLCLIAVLAGQGDCRWQEEPAPVSDPVASQLVPYWQSQVYRLQSGAPVLQINVWAHASRRVQSVTLMSGERVLESISGDAIDREGYEKRLLSAPTDELKSVEIPKLGIEGARRLAAKTEARLKLLNRPVHRLEVDRPMTYLVATCADGSVQAFDAETGESLWQANVGTPRYTTLPAGVCDLFVSVVNGTTLYNLSLETGKLISQQKLINTAAGVLPSDRHLFVTGLEGTTVGYDPMKRDANPWTAKNRGYSKASPVYSFDRRFVIWSVEPKYFVVTRIDEEKPKLWCRFESRDHVGRYAAPIANGFVISSREGTIARIELPSAENPNVRGNALAWRFGTGEAIQQTPFASYGNVYAVSVEQNLIALKSANGEPAWGSRPGKVRQIVGANRDFVYVLDTQDMVRVLRASDGSEAAAYPAPGPQAMVNHINDRLYFLTASGKLVAMRESLAVSPTLHADYVEPARKQEILKVRSASEEGDDADSMFGDEESGESNPFDDKGSEDIPF